MELTAEQFEDLLGAYALDACEPDEVEAMDRYAGAHPEAAAAVERLRSVAAGLGASGAQRPPTSLRDRVLEGAVERVRPLPADEALQKETDRFARFLATITPDEVNAPTHNGLTVHELVQHLEVIDRAFVEAAADPAAFIGPTEVAAITRDDLPGRVDERFADSVARFRNTRAELIALPGRIASGRRVAGYGRDDTLVIRAFETWTHHGDIERALGRPVTVPEAGVMRAMAELAMQSMPLALAVTGTNHPGRSVRFVLSGPGGGEWTVPCDPGSEPAATPDAVVRGSVIDWCRRFADRIPPDDLERRLEIEGDEPLVREFVAAAPVFAGL